MTAYLVILPVTVLVAIALLVVLARQIRSGRFEDLEDEKHRIFHDEPPR